MHPYGTVISRSCARTSVITSTRWRRCWALMGSLSLWMRRTGRCGRRLWSWWSRLSICSCRIFPMSQCFAMSNADFAHWRVMPSMRWTIICLRQGCADSGVCRLFLINTLRVSHRRSWSRSMGHARFSWSRFLRSGEWQKRRRQGSIPLGSMSCLLHWVVRGS